MPEATPAPVEATPEPTPEPTPTPVPLSGLEPVLAEMTASYGGEWGIWIKDLKTSEELNLNSHQMRSASLIKLFTAGRYFQAVEAGEIQATEKTEKYLQKMISLSDNDAWVALETAIGKGSYKTGYRSVTEFANSLGYPDTGRQIITGGSSKKRNLTSAESVGRVLYSIYAGTYVSRNCSATVLDYMKNQHFRYKIPQELPEGIACANKTGELNSIQNDAAIVYGEKKDYIIVIMSDGVSANHVIDDIISISAAVYEYLNS